MIRLFNLCGILLSFFAVFLQIAVFLQPLLPEQYQVSPICETISRGLLQDLQHNKLQHRYAIVDHHVDSHTSPHKIASSLLLSAQSSQTSHQHDMNHQCQYCTVYANLVLPPELGIKEVLSAVQVRLLFFKQQLAYVYFVLQRLFLLPQGRAPPVFS